MPTMPSNDGSTRPGVVPQVAAGIATLVGTLVLLGWLLDVPALRTLLPGTNPMVASTAACFILTGVSLWLQRQPAGQSARWAARTLALAAAAIGLLKLSEYAFGWDLGIDQTFSVINPGPFPGEMALLTAITFMLSGTALAILDLETRREGRPAQVLAAVALIPPLFGLIGRLFGVPTLSSVLAGTVVMALHTALTFVILCVGILAARADRGLMRLGTASGPAGILLRRLLPGTILILFLVGWLRLTGEEAGLFSTEFGVALMVVTSIVLLTTLIWRSAHSLERAEAARRGSDERFREVFENSPDAIVTITPDSLITYFSPGAEAMFGYRAAEIVGQPVTWLMPEPYRRQHEAGMGRYLRTGEARVIGNTVELEGLTRNGTVFSVELSISSWNTVEGPAFIGIIRDLSIRKEAEEAIRTAREEAERARDQAEEAQRAAEEANRAKSEFLSRMSHELRTPLNAVLGFGQLLEMEDLDADSKESVGQIIRAGRHLLDLINEVLDISRIEAGRLSLSLEPVSVLDLASEAAEMVRPMAAERKIKLQTDPGELRARYVLADRQRLKQVILNLLSNAVKYNREGGWVTMSLRSTDEKRVRLEVADSGEGIAEEAIDRLFLPFQRLGAEATAVEGTGLGLALSKGLVEAMGGAIGASSVPGEGTTFWVDLAEAEAPAALVGSDDADPIPASSSDGERTVLYVEDNVPNLRLVEQVAARRPRIRLLSAMQGQMGIDLARQHCPDLILLDLHLPDMSGEEVLEALRGDPATSAIPVVMISADATSSTAKRLLEAGARSYLTKPLDMRRFVRLLEGG